MSELDRAIGLEEAKVPPRSPPRFILTPHQAAASFFVAYLVLIAFMAGLLVAVERVQHIDDDRNIDATLIFAAVMAMPLAWALVNVYRRSPRPTWPS